MTDLLQEIDGYEKKKEAIQKNMEFEKLFLKSLDKKIRAVQELLYSQSIIFNTDLITIPEKDKVFLEKGIDSTKEPEKNG
jgi:hypothetical protein